MRTLLLVAVGGMLLGCSSKVVLRDRDAGSDASSQGGATSSTGGSANGGGTATGGGAGTSATGGAGGGATGCPTGLEGPTLVQIDQFCIDSTEVTNAQYDKFVTAKNGDTSGQVAGCTDNTSYAPSDFWPAATDAANQPVVYVDWCDANAYCQWAGKHLCGKIGGGQNPYDAYNDELRSQWYRACSNGGRNVYPYGGTFDPAKCNGFDGPEGCNSSINVPDGTCVFADVGTYSGCQGAGVYAGVFDLSGNAMEWEDSCTQKADGGVDVCRIRGGSIYAQAEISMACDDDDGEARLYTAPGVGFRCCAR